MLKTVKERDIKLVGLSALMTTTVVAMEETIKLLHSEVPGVKIIVGGAVLTPEYAKQIGADYYAKDAAESERQKIVAEANREAVAIAEDAMEKLMAAQTAQAYDAFVNAAKEEQNEH